MMIKIFPKLQHPIELSDSVAAVKSLLENWVNCLKKVVQMH